MQDAARLNPLMLLRLHVETGEVVRIFKSYGGRYLCTTNVWYDKPWNTEHCFWVDADKLRRLNEMELIGVSSV